MPKALLEALQSIFRRKIGAQLRHCMDDDDAAFDAKVDALCLASVATERESRR
jgi:hypothetical protein